MSRTSKHLFRPQWTPVALAVRGVIASGIAVTLLTGLSDLPAYAAEVTPADRARCVELMVSGGPAVSRAAEAALIGSDAELSAFLSAGLAEAKAFDDRTSVEEIMAAGGPALKLAGERALAASPAAAATFLTTGYRDPMNRDLRIRVGQLMTVGGPGVKEAAQKALDGTPDDVMNFLGTGISYLTTGNDGDGNPWEIGANPYKGEYWDVRNKDRASHRIWLCVFARVCR